MTGTQSGVKRVVGFSGGIDSQACARWVRQRFPAEDVILLNTLAGRNEHPLTEGFIKWYSDTIFPVTTITPLVRDLENYGSRSLPAAARRSEFSEDQELTFEMLAYIKGRFPSSQAQFCTETLKLIPQRRWTNENLAAYEIDFERYVGVRRDESRKRKETPERRFDEFFDCYVNFPLASWTKKQCFDYVTEAGEEYNPLYRMGFGRVGCAPCINSSKQDVWLWASRFPEMIDKIRSWEKSVGRTFFAPCVPGKEINWIDEVVIWSKTAHGGKQFLIPLLEIEAEEGTCSSKYGLCE